MHSSVVIDASFACRLILPNAAQAQVNGMMAEWQQQGTRLLAPALWVYEVTSAVTRVVQAKTLSEEAGRRALALAMKLDVRLVEPDARQIQSAYEWTRRLKRAAAYDSFYLALAEAEACELWTADLRLVAAANRPWVRSAPHPE